MSIQDLLEDSFSITYKNYIFSYIKMFDNSRKLLIFAPVTYIKTISLLTMKRIIISMLMAPVVAMAAAQNDMTAFVSNLMAKMTLEEKIGQLNLQPGNDITTGEAVEGSILNLAAQGKLGAVLSVREKETIIKLQQTAVGKSRLGIPLLIGYDVIHGFQTVFPIPLAQACSWNLNAIENAARISAYEATCNGINWVYSPMVDICTDPRWGRIAEGAGEDPYLGSLIAKAYVRGYQGDMSWQNVLACVKHYALYGAAEAGRDYNTVDMGRLRMHNRYLPPYKAAVEAGVGSVMTSFNVVDGIPATANKWLVNDILRDSWKFDGFVVTDYSSIKEMTTHGTGDITTATARAMKAGTDMDMCSKAFINHAKECVDNGTLTITDIENACRRVLEAKYKLGLFNDPYRRSDKRSDRELYNKENRKAARDFAAETFVLLKNDNNILPLKKQGKIALIGPLADTRTNIVGCWSTADKCELYSTLHEAMVRAVGNKAEVMCAQGCNIYTERKMQDECSFGRPIEWVDPKLAAEEAMKIVENADVVVCAMGEMTEMSGESSSRSDISLPEAQMSLLRTIASTGKPVVLLNFAGRPTVLDWESKNVDAILNVWFAGSETGDAICDVLFGDKAPCGRLVTTMPRNVGQIPIYYNHLSTGRPVKESADKYYKYQSNYIDVRNTPLYPFGYGLTYTTFSYSDITIEGTKAKVTVSNTGKREGTEVVQLYIQDPDAYISRPVKELKGFCRLSLKPGESTVVEFNITKDMLSYRDYDGKEVFEPGTFYIMIGPDSSDKNLRRASIQM